MLHQGAFHLKGTDSKAGALDHVVNAAHKPEVAVLVPIGHVAGVVQPAHEGLLSPLLILVVAGKHTEGSPLVQPDDNLAHFLWLAGAALTVHNVDGVAGGGLSHGAWLWLHAVKVADGEGQLRLAVALLHLDSSLFQKLVVDFAVEGLSCGGAVDKAGKVVLGKVLPYQIAIDSGGSTEGGDLVPLHLFQQTAGDKGHHVVGEYGASSQPLAVNLAPDCLCPASLGQGQVEAAVHHLLPVAGGDDVAQGIGKVVLHHLGIAGGAGGKVEQHDVLVGGGPVPLWSGKVIRLVWVFICKGHPTISVSCGNQGFDCGRIRECQVDLPLQILVLQRHNHLDGRRIGAILNVAFQQQVGGGNGNGSDFVEGQQKVPELVAAAENQHYRIALLDSFGKEKVGRLVGSCF